jgi:hypothetical protein
LDQIGVESEVIVVDDGSTDGSLEIAHEFGSRIQVLTGPRKGATSARNLAWRQGSGEWVQFLDADDYLESGKIRTQLDEAGADSKTDVIYSSVWIETWKDGASSREKSDTSPNDDIFTQWIRWRIPQTGGALWRRSALERLDGWKEDQPCCQEHELYLRALMAGMSFHYAPTPGAVYRIWSEETLCRKDPKNVARVRTGLIDTMLDWLTSSQKLTPLHRDAAGQVFFEQARTLARFDLEEAAAYSAERKARGFFHAAGPAAPLTYRMIYALAGFKAAERIANALR